MFARLDGVAFLLGSTALVPYLMLIWWERAMFNRAVVLAPTLIFALVLQYWYAGGRSWLDELRSGRARFALLILACLILGSASFLVLFSVVLCAVVFGFVHRLLDLGRVPRRYLSPGFQVGVLALTLLILFPAMNAGYFVRGTLRHIDPYVVQENAYYETNASGYRGPEVADPKRSGTRRLVFLGDSVTFGFPFPYADSYAAIVGRAIANRGGDVEIVSAGVIGQSLIQSHANLDRYLAMEPDVVLVMHGMHYEKSLENLRQEKEFSGNKLDHSFQYEIAVPVLSEIFHLGTLRTSLYAALTWSEAERDRDANLDLFQETLEELTGRARAAGVPIHFLEFPSARVPRANAVTRAVAERMGVPFVPLLALIDGYALDDGVHPDRAGHERMADAIVSHLGVAETGLVPEQPLVTSSLSGDR